MTIDKSELLLWMVYWFLLGLGIGLFVALIEII